LELGLGGSPIFNFNSLIRKVPFLKRPLSFNPFNYFWPIPSFPGNYSLKGSPKRLSLNLRGLA